MCILIYMLVHYVGFPNGQNRTYKVFIVHKVLLLWELGKNVLYYTSNVDCFEPGCGFRYYTMEVLWYIS